VDGGSEDEPKRVEAPSPSKLEPSFETRGSSGVVPDKLVVKFDRDVVTEAGIDANDETEISLEPDIEGSWRFEDRDELVFTPDEAIPPGEDIDVELRSVGFETYERSDDGEFTRVDIERLEPSSAWTHTYEIPDFELQEVTTPSASAGTDVVKVGLLFTAAVDPSTLDEYARWRIDGERVEGPVTFESGSSEYVVYATVRHAGFEEERGDANLELTLDEGLPYAHDDAIRAGATTREAEIAFGEPIEIEHTTVEEGVDGHYLYVICHDPEAGSRETFHNVIGYRDFNVSSRCTPNADTVERFIDIEPEVDFEIAPATAGFQLRGDFEQRTYNVRFRPGLSTVDGGYLDEVFEREFEVEERSPIVQIVGEGRYIPPEAWDNLAIRHRNVDELTVEVRHVPPENLHFWMSDHREQADNRTSNLVGETTFKSGGEEDEMKTQFIDLDDIVGERKPGLYDVRLEEGGDDDDRPHHHRGRDQTRDEARLVLTDLNLLAKRSAAGPDRAWSEEVVVWALDIESGEPRPGVDVELVRPSGFKMGECTSGEDGSCRIDVPDRDTDPTPPFALIASDDDDVSYLKYDDVETRLTDVDTSGDPYRTKRPYEATVYGDRDMYRPGETVNLVGVLREENAGAPDEGLPVEYELFDARDRKVDDGVEKTSKTGSIELNHPLDDFSSTGRWRLKLSVGERVVTYYDFFVEEFVPERMEVDVAAENDHLKRDDDARFQVDARYLFGASAEGSDVELRCRLEPTTFTPEGHGGYHFGPADYEDEDKSSIELGKTSGTIDKDDSAALDCPEVDSFDGSSARLVAEASVFEAGSGRTTDAETRAWLHPHDHYVGLKSDVSRVEADKPVTVEGVLVDPQGERVDHLDEVTLELTHLERHYSWYRHRGTSESNWQPIIYDTKTVEVEDGAFETTFTPSQVKDGFVITARAGGTESSLQLGAQRTYYSPRSYTNHTPKPDDPTGLDVEGPEEVELDTDHELTFKAPYRGKALVALESDRVLEHEIIDVEPGENSWEFSLDEQLPNVYGTVFLIKDPHLDSKAEFLPERAFGATSMKVDRSDYRQELTIETPDQIEPNETLEVDVDAGRLDEETEVTVAAVDQGILQLSDYETPDPLDGLLPRRRLGVDTFDTVGWNVMMPKPGQEGPPGGGEPDQQAKEEGRIMPVEPVALWSGRVELPESGKKTIELDVPQYRGELRVMATSLSESRVGVAEDEVKVSDPLSIQATTPRFLTSGDEVEIPVAVTNTTDRKRRVTVSIDSEELDLAADSYLRGLDAPVAFEEDMQSRSVDPGETAQFAFRGRTDAISGGVDFEITAKDGSLRSRHTGKAPVRPDKPSERTVETVKLDEGTHDLTDHLDGWVPHSERSTFWVSHLPYGEAFDHLKFLVRYPHGCVEQTTSSTRPMVYLAPLLQAADPEEGRSDEAIEKRVESGIQRVLSMQNSSGGFGYWSHSSGSFYSTALVSHMLMDAREAGYDVPKKRLEDALDWLADTSDDNADNRRSGYAHYVLAQTGRANKTDIRDALEHFEEEEDELNGHDYEQQYLLKAALYLAGDRRHEDELEDPDPSRDSGEREASKSFYSDLRRKGLMLYVFVDLFGDEKAGKELADEVAADLQSKDFGHYNTQELTWAISGLGKWVGKSSGDVEGELRTNGEIQSPAVDNDLGQSWSLARAADLDSLDLSVETEDDSSAFLIISSEGVREEPTVSSESEGLTVEREYLDDDGDPLDEDDHRLGDIAFARVTVENTSGSSQENVAIVDRIPAGWEIEDPEEAADQIGPQFYSEQKFEPEHIDVRDDRLATFGSLGAGHERQVVYPVRATLSGTFHVPGVTAESMYRPDIRARDDSESLTVHGPWGELID
ncbi:MAG: alpha-2-macroglobulin family protein, partial [Persicimonas sp.]